MTLNKSMGGKILGRWAQNVVQLEGELEDTKNSLLTLQT
jgi:hypothetical protein